MEQVYQVRFLQEGRGRAPLLADGKRDDLPAPKVEGKRDARPTPRARWRWPGSNRLGNPRKGPRSGTTASRAVGWG